MAPSNRDALLLKSNNKEAKYSAVVLLLYKQNNEWFTVLIKRPDYNGPHGGQISLPGGKYDKQDKNLLYTAIRECYEETGVLLTEKNILIQLTDLVIPKTLMNVRPFVAYTPEKPVFSPDKREVEQLIHCSLSNLFNDKNKKTQNIIEQNKTITIPYYEINSYKVWGATAMILREFEDIYKS